MPRTLNPAVESVSAGDTPKPGRFDRLIAEYRHDHRNPINHFLHVGVGWPIAALAVITFPFRPLWGIGLIALAYAFMFSGHFVFERNIPTVLKHPSTPFVVAANVIRSMGGTVLRWVSPGR